MCNIFHPNIYPDGRVCISILHSPGDDPTAMKQAQKDVLSLLAEPNVESPANVDAAKMWREDRPQFKKIADNLVRKTLGLVVKSEKKQV
uniref:UBC core domain-containing protein n=1 Tax=Ditylenchus dipsaci TaxID=166011 RepID=A0A915DS10_9BILA